MAVFTISRQFGAGGLTLGKLIANKLNYTLYDNELIQLLANKANVSPEWIVSMEKEAGGALQKIMSSLVSKSLVDRILDDSRGYIDEKIYVNLLHKIIEKIAKEGNAVIIGRGGQYVLKGRDDVKNILLVAKKKDRIRFIEEHYNLTHKQARQSVNNDDKRRINLYRKFGKEDFDEPALYHMVFNTSKIKLDKACELVCDLA